MRPTFLSILFLILSLICFSYPVLSQQPQGYVVVVHIDSEITYGVQYLVEEGISEAEKLDAPLIMILDTPGGLLNAADNIVKAIRNSNVPVIGYVYPLGAQAWSAGTLILMATHIAAMAPGTLIGAVQPVLYDPTTGEYKPVNESKIINPIVGMITELAKDRGRNATAAELFVRRNLYLNAEKALKYHVIEVIAKDLNELLYKIDGWKIRLDNGREYVLHTAGAKPVEYKGSIRVYVVKAISNPTINSLLSTLGVLMLVFSLLSGHYLLIPLGAGLIILSLIGMGFSANIISLILLVIGAVALAIEIYTPGFGILGITGIIFISISIALLPILNPGWLVSPQYQAMLFWTGISAGIVLGGFTGFVLYKVIRAKKQPPKVVTVPIGAIGRAVDNFEPGSQGFIIVEGEYWKAISEEKISKNEKVIVIGKEGSLLKIKKLKEEESK